MAFTGHPVQIYIYTSKNIYSDLKSEHSARGPQSRGGRRVLPNHENQCQYSAGWDEGRRAERGT